MPRPGLFYKIESAITFAEEIAGGAEDRWVARRISGELVPALLEARTFVKVGQVSAREVADALAKASLIAGEMSDADPRYARLTSVMRVLREDAFAAGRARRK